MKTKLILSMLLSLFLVKGWASPVDSLKTHLTRLDSIRQWDRVERLDTLVPFDRFVRPGFDSNEFVIVDDNHEKRNPVAIILTILDLINQYQPFIYFDEIEDESETFIGVTVGTSASKKYRVYGDNVSGTNTLNRLLEILEAFNVVSGIKFDLLEQNTEEDFINVSNEIVVEPNYLRLSDFRDGKENTITITYRPTTERAHAFSCIGRYDLGFTNGLGNLVDYALLPVINIFGFEIASAVERTISTSESTVSCLNAPIGETTTQHFIIYGHNLTGPLKIEPSSEEIFSVYPKIISAEQAEKGAEVTVNYTPMSAGTHHTTITISGGGAYPEQKVDLIGCTGNPCFSVDPTSLTFNNATVGITEHQIFAVHGTNLTGPLFLNVETTGTKGHFTIDQDKYEISAAQVAEGAQVTVYYTPTEAGHLSGRITISGGSAENKTITLDGYAADPPRIIVDNNSLEFSDVKVGESEPRTFRVTGSNLTGDLTLTVDESDGNQFSIDKESITAADAANGVNVTVTYTPTEEGAHSGRILISGGGAESKSVSLSGSAQEPPRISVNPTSLSYPNKTVDKTYKQTFKVTGTNLTGDLTLTKDESDGGQFTFDKKTITAVEAKNGVNVTVTYAPTQEGSHSGRISVTGGGADKKTVSLSGSAKERIITTTASSLNIGKVAKGKSKTKKFTVKGTNLTGPLTLEATGTNKSLFTISPSSITATQAANGVEVSVTYKPTAKGSHTAKITISGGDALSDKTVSLSGQCVEPIISVSPGTLDFGNMDAGTSKTLSFTVTGTDLTGDMSLIAASTDSHADFTITPTTLGANASCATVKVTCTANIAGSISGRVTVSGGDATSKTVGLTGTAKCYITTNHSSLSYSPSSLNKSVKVTCVGANSKLSLALTGDDASYFRLGTSSISMADARDGKTVSVACVPKTKDRLSAKIKISGGGADDLKYVSLSYSNGVVSINSVQPDGESEGDNEDFTNGGSLEPFENTTDLNELAMNSKVYAEGLSIIIETTIEQKALISDMAGHVREINLQAGRNEIPVNASGIYIVRIREKSTKLMLK